MKYITSFLFLLSSLNINAQLLTEGDKKMHYAAGAIVGGVTYAYVMEETDDKLKAFAASLGSAILIGSVKELIDSTQPGNLFDTRDLLATTYGGISISLTFDLIARKGKNGKSIVRLKL